MSIYPYVSWDRKLDSDLNWIIVRTEKTPGLKVIETYTLESRQEHRTDCFCCSCGEFGTDGACRNHGGYGKRPCEEHNMPGSPWEGTNDMPESVQAERKRLLHDNA